MKTKDQQTQSEFEHWLEHEVGPTYDAVMADPSQCIPIKKAFAELRRKKGLKRS
jgi:hypothetical protein